MAIPVIYKGDDTNFNGSNTLSLSITTSVSLVGCTVEFTFLGQKRTFTGSASLSTISFSFSAAETAGMPVGTHKAKIRVFDAERRVKTISEPKIRVTDDLSEAYTGGGAQSISVNVTETSSKLVATDVFDCTCAFSALKERVAYLWEKCGGTVTNRSQLTYED